MIFNIHNAIEKEKLKAIKKIIAEQTKLIYKCKKYDSRADSNFQVSYAALGGAISPAFVAVPPMDKIFTAIKNSAGAAYAVAKTVGVFGAIFCVILLVVYLFTGMQKAKKASKRIFIGCIISILSIIFIIFMYNLSTGFDSLQIY